jgi:hypothetical protein
LVLGWAQTRWDATAMLATEAGFGVIGLLVFAIAVRWSRPVTTSAQAS